MKVQSPPGMRDFYPDEMRLQNWLFDKWRSVSRSFGFVEYDAPIFEYLDLYRLKSGEEIVSELFTLTDRGGREFAIRPEMTPSLARMVAARANALPKPIKWFSIPRMCRAEKPQRGRLREFYQWNADVLGTEDPLADAEVIALSAALLRAVGLGADDVSIRINSRPVATAALRALGLPPSGVETAFTLIDRRERIGEAAFVEMWDKEFAAEVAAPRVLEFLDIPEMNDVISFLEKRAIPDSLDIQETIRPLRELWRRLAQLGVDEYCACDLNIVRGLAYYTGSVFEIHPKAGGLRALLGGGRYDDLTGLLDGPRVPGVGFGAGDVPLLECLKQLGKLPVLSDSLDVFVIDADRDLFPTVLEIAAKLRAAGLSSDFSYKRAGVGKQFKQASARAARAAIVVGREFSERGELVVKNLIGGTQTTVAAADLLKDPAAHL